MPSESFFNLPVVTTTLYACACSHNTLCLNYICNYKYVYRVYTPLAIKTGHSVQSERRGCPSLPYFLFPTQQQAASRPAERARQRRQNQAVLLRHPPTESAGLHRCPTGVLPLHSQSLPDSSLHATHRLVHQDTQESSRPVYHEGEACQYSLNSKDMHMWTCRLLYGFFRWG